MRLERMDQIPEMCVMTRLIRAQCVQTLVRRNNEESSHRFKHIKVNSGSGSGTKIMPIRPEFDPELEPAAVG